MNGPIRSFLFVAAALFAVGAGAKADDKKDIEKLYATLSKHIKANNPEAILPLETPDYKSKTQTGQTLDGKQQVAMMKQQGAGNKIKKFDIKITKMTVRGKTASVETSFSAASESKDQKGKTHVMEMTGGVHNDLVKTKDGWKFTYMEEKAGTMKMDGKPFDPSKMGGGAPPPPKKK